jgi:hypothetical protein
MHDHNPINMSETWISMIQGSTEVKPADSKRQVVEKVYLK